MEIDLSFIEEASQGNKELKVDLIQSFIDQATSDLKQMNKAAMNNDCERVAQMAHKLKSSIAVFGLNSIVKLVREVEDLALNEKRVNIDEINSLLEQMNKVCDNLRRFVR